MLIPTSQEWIGGRCCSIYFPLERSLLEVKLWFSLRLPIMWLFFCGPVCFLWFKKNLFIGFFLHPPSRRLCVWPVDGGLKSHVANSTCLLSSVLGVISHSQGILLSAFSPGLRVNPELAGFLSASMKVFELWFSCLCWDLEIFIFSNFKHTFHLKNIFFPPYWKG